MRTVIRSIQALMGHCGVDSGLDLICLHGRPDLHAAAKGELEAGLGTRVQATNGPALDDDSIAFGLALGAFDGPDTFDLARDLKPDPPLRDIFPWGELAVQAALLVCMVLTLGSRYFSREDRLETLQAEAARQTSRDAVPESELLREKKDLEQKVESVRRCLSTRVLWTTYTHDIAARLPPGVTLTAFLGQAEMAEGSPKKEGGGGRTRRSLLLKGSAPIGPSGSTPPEIDTLLDALRADSMLRREFPSVELADIRLVQASEKTKASVTFTILCLPEKERGGAAGGGKR